MDALALAATGGGLVAVVVVILAMTLTRRHRLDQSANVRGAGVTDVAGTTSVTGATSAEQAEALRSVQEQIERGSRLL